MTELSYYMKNRIKMLERQKQYNEKNKQKIDNYNHEYWLKNKFRIYIKRNKLPSVTAYSKVSNNNMVYF